MNKNTDQLQRVDELLEDGRKRREFEQAVIEFRKQMERNPWLGFVMIFMGFALVTAAFFSGLFITIDDKHVLQADGIPHLLLAINFFYMGARLIWKKPANRILLTLLEDAMRERQSKS